ncbi:MAG: DegQ family serine endoprotease [Gammaproteobacteria bacterium]
MSRFRVILAFVALLAGAPAPAAVQLPDFADLSARVSPAVVNIGTTLKRGQGPAGLPPGMQMPDIPQDSPLYEFFRRFFGEGGGDPGDVEPRSSLGSGFIISADGYVVTNYHVIKDAEEITVRLSDRREFAAKLIGSDERSDLAVLKVEASNLPVVQIGDSSKLRVGEWVLAIGSPFGFEYSVTAGIVSAKGRNLPNENYVPFIQTDVAINPGNSGGPLFNLDGQVVGVNSQIYSRTGGFMGLSFAIPMEVAYKVYEQLRDKGAVTRGWLGVLIQDVTRELAESFGMGKPRGALVSKVLPDSPAAAAGMQAGDIVVAFNDQPIDVSSDLPPLVGNTKVGDDIPVRVIRNGKAQVLKVRIGELPPAEEPSRAGADQTPSTANLDRRLQVEVRDLGDSQRRELNVDEGGVLVEDVKDGPAKKAGVRPGDVLLQIDNQVVRNAAHLRELTPKLPAGKSVPLLVQRRGGPLFLAMKLPDAK